jgi:hypothetical protein
METKNFELEKLTPAELKETSGGCVGLILFVVGFIVGFAVTADQLN